MGIPPVSHLLFWVLFRCVSCAFGSFIIEKGGVEVEFPAEGRASFDMALADFGQPKYGGRISGRVIYMTNQTRDLNITCTPSCNYACQSFSELDPPFRLEDDLEGSILLVDRGPVEEGSPACSFVNKTWNAQMAGAIGVIVVNNQDRLLTPNAPDDVEAPEFIKNLTIPAGFVTSSVGDAIKILLRGNDDVVVAMDWVDALPRQEKVHWELWMNSNDNCGSNCDLQRQFIRDFSWHSRQLQQNNYTVFTPHYLIWKCPGQLGDSDECQSQCIRQGRYCSPDPEEDIETGYQGKDVMMENLRQLCLHEIASHAGKEWLWWDYAIRFWDECSIKKREYGITCSEKVFMQINGQSLATGNGLAEWRDCIKQDAMDADADISLLDKEQRLQSGKGNQSSVHIIPTIRINGNQYRGILEASSVLRAICSGFPLGQEPHVCVREWVSEDECKRGEIGYLTCNNSTNTEAGRTTCKNTFSGFDCTCGDGYLEVEDEQEAAVCMDVNECENSSLLAKYKDCSCERCVCHNLEGSFRCEYDVRNDCNMRNGGCWEDSIDGKYFTACVDLLDQYKAAAASGEAKFASADLHKCVCPKCFYEAEDGTCKPLCDLGECERAGGDCTTALLQLETTAVRKSRISMVGLTAGLVLLAMVIIPAGIFGYYRIRRHMHNELDVIMTHYMPLDETKRVDAQEPGGQDDDVIRAGQTSATTISL